MRKPELQADAAKREITSIKFQKWEGGKPVGEFKFQKSSYVKVPEVPKIVP